MAPRRVTVKFFTHDGDELELPGKHEVCPRCEGHGTHVNPNIDGNGLSAEDFDEAGPEFREDYLGGVYDVACEECRGARVVVVPDFERWTVEQRAEYERAQREAAESRAIENAERRAEAWASGERW